MIRLDLPDIDALALIREALASKLTTLNNLAIGVRAPRRPDLSGKSRRDRARARARRPQIGGSPIWLDSHINWMVIE